jgi:hypothetical protein
MQAVHIHAEGVRDDNESAFVEMMLRLTRGVKDVATIRSLHLISVLYDERDASLAMILATIRRAGFRAHVVQPNAFLKRESRQTARSAY